MRVTTQATRILALVLLVTAMGFGAESGHGKEIDAIFSKYSSANAPGLAVLVVKDGKLVFERGYGITDLRTGRKINAATDFRLASVSKQFTAMAVMLLVHDGKLRYDETLSEIFPEFPAYGKTITIRNLLNHTSGLVDYEDLLTPQPGVEEDRLVQVKDAGVLELMKQQKSTKFAPGTHWEYSNSGYVVLGMVVQKISSKPFAQFLHDRIFAPLHMDGTLAYEKPVREHERDVPAEDKDAPATSAPELIPHRAFGHTQKNGRWIQNDQSGTSVTLGDGGIYSSLNDLTKWDAALRNHTLLSESEMQPALTPVKVGDNSVRGPDNEPAAYGFGWYLNPYKSHRRMWHYGETVGFRTNIERFVDDVLTIIVLCNRDDINPSQPALRVADLYLTKTSE
jgi:CubicO group peptidase (beta-lactamase class C family)